MLKVVLIGFTAVFLALLAGNIKKEYGFIIAACGALIIFSYGITKISVIVEEVNSFEKSIGLDGEYIAILLKMVGIAYMTQFAVSLCRDAGHGAIASQIGFAGKISMLIVSIPVLKALVRTIGELFG
ncbi:MAG: stage III sporulation protein AD [Lachnospiraceae bacterium]|nr:stage III sporulation protein AD [Lachnospiraceae bacterium]